MIKEHIRAIGNWLREENESLRESKRFHQFFPIGIREYDGVLTKPQDEIDPLLKGVITAEGSFGIMDKLEKGKKLSEKERKRVREAAWITSLGGHYTFTLLEADESLIIDVSLDNDEASNYLVRNIEGIVAFLFHKKGRQYRYNEAIVKQFVNNGELSILFQFSQVTQIPEKTSDLYLYTPPIEPNIAADERFLRLNLLLL